MTVISSVYKDNDVKCHTSQANLPGVHPGFSSLFCSTSLSCFPLAFLVPSPFLPASAFCYRFIFTAAEIFSLSAVSNPAPSCMLRCLVVATNGRVNICIYVRKSFFFLSTTEQDANKMVKYDKNKVCLSSFINSFFCFNCTISFFLINLGSTSRRLQLKKKEIYKKYFYFLSVSAD